MFFVQNRNLFSTRCCTWGLTGQITEVVPLLCKHHCRNHVQLFPQQFQGKDQNSISCSNPSCFLFLQRIPNSKDQLQSVNLNVELQGIPPFSITLLTSRERSLKEKHRVKTSIGTSVRSQINPLPTAQSQASQTPYQKPGLPVPAPALQLRL